MSRHNIDHTTSSDGGLLSDYSRRAALSGLLVAGGALLPSRQAAAATGPIICASYSDLVNAVASVGPTGGYITCQPGAVITFGASPLVIANKSFLTIDFSGAQIQATANTTNTQLYQPALVYLQNCTGCHITGKALFNGAGFENSALGLATCTDCVVELLVATSCNIGFGQFFSVGSTRCTWKHCHAYNGQGTARGFWLGGVQTGWGETDLEVLGCRAIGNPATGIAVIANGARLIGNVSTDNAGAGIVSSSNGGGWLGYFNTVVGNDCRRNLFWGWQSDVSNGAQLFSTAVHSNIFDSNKTGAALINECSTIMYGGNIDNGNVQVLNSTNGKIQLGPGATLVNSGGNSNIAFS